MKFVPIDFDNWNRKEHFTHYFDHVPCSYSMCVQLDAAHLYSRVKGLGLKLYPVLIFGLAKLVNAHSEFRMAMDAEGHVGFYDGINPSYTVFHSEQETFSAIWTEYDDDFWVFYRRFQRDQEEYGANTAFEAKPAGERPVFNISCIPWAHFNGFTLHLPEGGQYLLPIFTIGQMQEESGKRLLPLAVQVHHAVCDGFHTARLIRELQKWMDRF